MAGLDREAKTMFEWAVKNDPSNATAREGLLGANRALGVADDDCSLRCEPDSPSGLDEGGGLAPPIHEEALSPQHSALQGDHLCSSVGKSLGHP